MNTTVATERHARFVRQLGGRLQAGAWRVEMGLAKRLYQAADLGWSGGDAVWRSVMNARAAIRQRRQPLPVATPAAQRALEHLRRDGIVMLHVTELAGGDQLFAKLVEQERGIVRSRDGEIAARRAAIVGGRSAKYKGFLIRTEPGQREIPFEEPSVQLAVHPELLGIVNGALGLYSHVRKLEFWYTVSSPGQIAEYSQLWHRDYEDLKLIKAFIYLDEVGEDSGAFAFVRGTHRDALLRGAPERLTPKAANRFDDAEMERWVSRERWCSGTGPAGTIVLAMTKGYHKGGLATTRDRRLLTASYLSPWCKDYFLPKRVVRVPTDAHPAIRWAVDPQASMAEARSR
jgi:hypothetical protein